jgi:RNA polymerase sigma-70 factor (ECF subfamily)
MTDSPRRDGATTRLAYDAHRTPRDDAMPVADFSSELNSHRAYLLRVARLQLRDEALAEDVVQETLLAALAGAGFSGRSSLKTWLTGILKHKIVDAIRRKQREPLATAELGNLDAELDIEDFDALFRANGAWDAPPSDWGNPEEALERREFLDIMDFCLEKLPANTARVFMMREVMELETDEICKELAITANNLWVILYRARMALRRCLEQNWFAQQGERA